MSISSKVQNDAVSKRDEYSEFEDDGHTYIIKFMHYVSRSSNYKLNHYFY